MCFQKLIVNNKSLKRHDFILNCSKIAQKDIIVYKLLKKPSFFKRYILRIYKSPFRGFLYKLNKVYFENLDAIVSNAILFEFENSTELYINNGLHSYKDYPLTKTSKHSIVAQGIIPQGSTYWENNYQYVSTGLQLTKIIK